MLIIIILTLSIWPFCHFDVEEKYAVLAWTRLSLPRFSAAATIGRCVRERLQCACLYMHALLHCVGSCALYPSEVSQLDTSPPGEHSSKHQQVLIAHVTDECTYGHRCRIFPRFLLNFFVLSLQPVVFSSPF